MNIVRPKNFSYVAYRYCFVNLEVEFLCTDDSIPFTLSDISLEGTENTNLVLSENSSSGDTFFLQIKGAFYEAGLKTLAIVISGGGFEATEYIQIDVRENIMYTGNPMVIYSAGKMADLYVEDHHLSGNYVKICRLQGSAPIKALNEIEADPGYEFRVDEILNSHLAADMWKDSAPLKNDEVGAYRMEKTIRNFYLQGTSDFWVCPKLTAIYGNPSAELFQEDDWDPRRAKSFQTHHIPTIRRKGRYVLDSPNLTLMGLLKPETDYSPLTIYGSESEDPLETLPYLDGWEMKGMWRVGTRNYSIFNTGKGISVWGSHPDIPDFKPEAFLNGKDCEFAVIYDDKLEIYTRQRMPSDNLEVWHFNPENQTFSLFATFIPPIGHSCTFVRQCQYRSCDKVLITLAVAILGDPIGVYFEDLIAGSFNINITVAVAYPTDPLNCFANFDEDDFVVYIKGENTVYKWNSGSSTFSSYIEGQPVPAQIMLFYRDEEGPPLLTLVSEDGNDCVAAYTDGPFLYLRTVTQKNIANFIDIKKFGETVLFLLDSGSYVTYDSAAHEISKEDNIEAIVGKSGFFWFEDNRFQSFRLNNNLGLFQLTMNLPGLATVQYPNPAVLAQFKPRLYLVENTSIWFRPNADPIEDAAKMNFYLSQTTRNEHQLVFRNRWGCYETIWVSGENERTLSSTSVQSEVYYDKGADFARGNQIIWRKLKPSLKANLRTEFLGKAEFEMLSNELIHSTEWYWIIDGVPQPILVLNNSFGEVMSQPNNYFIEFTIEKALRP